MNLSLIRFVNYLFIKLNLLWRKRCMLDIYKSYKKKKRKKVDDKFNRVLKKKDILMLTY